MIWFDLIPTLTLYFDHSLPVAVPREEIPVWIVDAELTSCQLREFPRGVAECAVLVHELYVIAGLHPTDLDVQKEENVVRFYPPNPDARSPCLAKLTCRALF